MCDAAARDAVETDARAKALCLGALRRLSWGEYDAVDEERLRNEILTTTAVDAASTRRGPAPRRTRLWPRCPIWSGGASRRGALEGGERGRGPTPTRRSRKRGSLRSALKTRARLRCRRPRRRRRSATSSRTPSSTASGRRATTRRRRTTSCTGSEQFMSRCCKMHQMRLQ